MSSNGSVVSVQGQAVAVAVATANASVRRALAVQNLLGAARFSREVGVIEAANSSAPFGEFFDEIIHKSTACVLLSAACLEAYANELFIDGTKTFPKIAPKTIDELWDLCEKEAILKKFQTVLKLLELEPLDKGKSAYQNAAIIIAMRNALTHFKAEWHDEDGSHAQLSKKIDTIFKPGAPYFSGKNMFPVRWMTHQNTKWVVSSVIEFLKAFEGQSGLPAKTDYSKIIP